MNQYLLDTNICIYFIKGLFDLESKFKEVGPENCFISEKARLQKDGKVIDDFDLLIGATAVSFDLIMVTNNINHFNRIKHLKLEDWTA